MNLHLQSPLSGGKDEEILCFELNSDQSSNIEPDKEQLLKGKIDKTSLPAGQYLFVQRRCEAHLDMDEWLDMAIEQQKDGLWERNKLGTLLYLRFLYEDGAYVTQVFREII